MNRLLVRNSYQTIAKRIRPGANKTIITGTPGIGKTLFLMYLTWKLVKAGKRVLLIYHPDTIYFDGQGGVFEFSCLPSLVDHTFWSADLWCLFDAKYKEKGDLHLFSCESCAFVLSTSPRRDFVNDFQKPPDPQFFFMPIWSQVELEAIAPYFDTRRNWRERYEILGGIPRHVFGKKNPNKLLQVACNKCSLDDCINIVGSDSEITEMSKVSHFFIHTTSLYPFTDSSLTFASQKALNLIVGQRGREVKKRIEELMESCDRNPLTTALCGYIFEPYALELLEKGGSFKCRQLVSGRKKQ